MHERTNIQLSAIDRSVLEAVVANRNSAQKHVWRAKIVLMTARTSCIVFGCIGLPRRLHSCSINDFGARSASNVKW